jgi:hypothetical protein
MIGMSQVRVYNQIKYLARYNDVDFASLYESVASLEATKQKISSYINTYYPLKSPRNDHNKIKRLFYKLKKHIIYHLSFKPMEDIVVSQNQIKKSIQDII